MANDQDDKTDGGSQEDKKAPRKKTAVRNKSASKAPQKKTAEKKATPKKTAEAQTKTKGGAASDASVKTAAKTKAGTAAGTTADAKADTAAIMTADEIVEAVTKPGPVKKDKRTGSTGRRSEDKVMPGLLKNLQGVFDKIYSDNKVRDRSHDQLAEEFTTHMQRAFLEMHKQIEERENLLETRLKGIDRSHKYQLQRVKLLSIPVTLLSIVAVVYLFYVVRVMETSMTSMSEDMHMMTAYMDTITTDTTALSTNTEKIYTTTNDMTQSVSAMNSQMTTLNTNVGNLMVDLNYMSHSVSPAMKGINRFLP